MHNIIQINLTLLKVKYYTIVRGMTSDITRNIIYFRVNYLNSRYEIELDNHLK